MLNDRLLGFLKLLFPFTFREAPLGNSRVVPDVICFGSVAEYSETSAEFAVKQQLEIEVGEDFPDEETHEHVEANAMGM